MKNPGDHTIERHLRGDPGGYHRRVALQRTADAALPSALRHPVSKAIWAGGLRHMRHFDHRYVFHRDDIRLASLDFMGREVARFTPLSALLPALDRPVSLIALGPSAKDHDWETLKSSGRTIVAVSGGGTLLKERGITPDLLVVTDPDFSKAAGYHVTNVPGVPLVIEFRAAAALHRHFPEALAGRRITALERVNKWYQIPALGKAGFQRMNASSGFPFRQADVPDKLQRAGWSMRAEVGFYPSATVVIPALQAIIAMGARDIEIIGMDLGGGNSLYADVGRSRLAEEYTRVILPSFIEMGRALARSGISIRNLSPTCPLPREIFPMKEV